MILMFADADEPMEEDEEALFTDVDENEDSSDEEDEEEEELLEDETEMETESNKPRNPFVDDEAEEDDDVDDPGYEDNDCCESQLQTASEDVALDAEHDDFVEREEQELPDINRSSCPISPLTQFGLTSNHHMIDLSLPERILPRLGVSNVYIFSLSGKSCKGTQRD